MHKLVAGMAAGLALAALATPGVAFAERVTPKTKLTENGLGPIRVGMTFKEARAATGQKIKVVAYSQGAVIASLEMRGLDPRLHVDDGRLSFVVIGNQSRPSGGLLSRFPGLTIPQLQHEFGGNLHSAPSTIVPHGTDYWVNASDPSRHLVYTFKHGALWVVAGGVLPESSYPRV